MKYLGTLFLVLGISVGSAAQTPQIWLDYQADKAAGVTPELTDYSFAGYHFSELEIPSVATWTYFDVTDYGAIADDELFDDDAIQSTIDAAQLHDGPAVVFFPSGKFIVSSDNNTGNKISITRDSVVLKGSGAGDGGTEIFMKEMRVLNGHWQFEFTPAGSIVPASSYMTASADRGDYDIIVQDGSVFEVGQDVLLSHQSEAFARAHFGDLELSENWYRLFGSGGGMSLYELHVIKEISGNRLTFVNPIQTDLPLLDIRYQVSRHNVISEIGVEDILFTSDWENYPEDFVHHKNDIHDYAWNAIQFENVKNSWVRDCEFRSWNQVIDVRQSIGVTIQDVVISGKQGHASFLTRRGYGLLVKDCEDQADTHHGPGTGYSGVNTVYLRCSMSQDQSFDSHSGQPYATLVDDVLGGVFNQNGGPYESYPHHGRGLTFWNFRHQSSKTLTYDFWSVDIRNGNTYAEPYFVGFQSNMTVNFLHEGLHQLPDQMVEPRSLFEAQLALRLDQQNTLPTVRFITPENGQELLIGADVPVQIEAADPDGTISKVQLYINDQLQREIDTAPYLWGEDELTDPLLFDMPAGKYRLKAIGTDNDGNTTTTTLDFTIGKAPKVEIGSPKNGAVVEAGVLLTATVSASDEDGTLAAVSLYLDDVLVRTITASPFVWGQDATVDPLLVLPSGEHVLKVIATDNDGLTAVDELTVIANASPALSFLSPTNQQVLDEGVDLIVEVSASDEDGTIVQVDLYMNGKLLRSDTRSPFKWGERSDADPALFGMKAGSYVFKAVAVDDLGSENSETISISIGSSEILSSDLVSDDVLVYPNPTKDVLTVQSNEPIQNVSLFDFSGKSTNLKWKNEEGNKMELSTAGLSQGIYFLRVDMKDSIEVFKIIKN
ncbi:DUF4955 domain-containing protein [Reichenbachiella agarivorans]|uniref:DUF4955 domain-containing protein n=1 Tax=Reichenbachiella agarivorans TaxID=2979464 RepID=A0ABY6CTQ6_9BACT|nr:Ig-like domain-containing protein [Reichenbachiella agarivorans]UXP32773.1 DUF4955 domain-containing protein [Reichenbachiella agarivorans]